MSILKANRIENLTTTDGGINVNNAGNVGIGTDSIASGGANTTNFNVHTPSATSVYLKLSNSSTGNSASDAFDLSADSSGNAYLINRENGNMTFWTNATERLRIDSSGRVGIGTSSPAFGVGSGLEIERAGSATLRIEDSASSSGFEIQNASGSIDFNGYNSQPFTFKHNTTERLRINSSGVTVSSGNLSMHSGGRIFVGNGGNAVNPIY